MLRLRSSTLRGRNNLPCTGATLGKRYLRVYPAAAAVACFRLGGVNPPQRWPKKKLSGLDLSQRLRKSRGIHVGRFSGPGDYSGPSSGHFRRFRHFGPYPLSETSTLEFNIGIPHWHSTLVFDIGIQHWQSTLVFNIGIQHWHSASTFNRRRRLLGGYPPHTRRRRYTQKSRGGS